MLTRERIALSMLEESAGHVSKTKFVKLMFLLRMETELKQYSSFYDFVPYKFGPYSFSLYRDLYRLEWHGYVSSGKHHFALNKKCIDETQQQTQKIARNLQCAVDNIVEHYGQIELSPLIKYVYKRYRWYALISERTERELFSIPSRPRATPAVYTTGYEGKTVDAFFNHLIEKGIETIIDVRANPVSRKYGFAGSRMKEIGEKLGMDYKHYPKLGISSSERKYLGDGVSLANLFTRYEKRTLARRKQEIKDVGNYMSKKPSVLVCVEKDVECCHRSRLSQVIAKETGMEVEHL